MDFGTFLGNDALRDALIRAQRSGKLSHSYLICGPEGAGKKTLARLVSAAMQCGDAHAPCGRCSACRKVFAGNHPDVITCVDEKHKQFGVDSARSICTDAFIRPNEGRRKVYIFPQELNLSAQNTLLKVIEEPPAYAAFLFLTTNSERLLPTVRSRCQELRLAPLPEPVLLAALRQRCPGKSEQDYRSAMSLSGGWLGQALEAIEQAGLSGRTAKFAHNFASRDKLALLELMVSMEKLNREEFCEEMAQWRSLLHQAMRAASGLPGSEEAAAIAKSHSPAILLQTIELLEQAGDKAQSNVGVGHLCGALRSTLLRI